MKKLLSVFAAAAVLFGFASCSGDMHDSVVSSLYAEGDFCEKDGDTTVRVKFNMTPGSDTEQTYVFKYDSKMTAWGGSNGTVNFKIVRDETGWLKDWGWLKDTKVELSVNSTEWLDLEGRGGSNDNPGNIVLKDLVVGNSYKLILKYDAPAEKVSIKCTGAVTDYPILKAHIVDAADGKELTDALADDNSDVILVRSGTSYSSEIFVPTKDGKIEYYLTNGYLYWGADGEMSTTKPTDDYFVGEWKFDENNADFPYSFFVDANNFADSAKFNSDVRIYDTSILSNADIIGLNGDWDNGKKLSFIDGVSYTYDFTAGGETESFVIRENAGTWNPRWFAGIPAGKDKPATAKLADDIEVDKDSVEAVYYEADPGLAGSNLTIKGLSEKSVYTITIKIENAANKIISISCKLKQYVVPPKYSFEGAVLKGGWEGWWKDERTMTADAIQEFEVTASGDSDEHPASGNQFGMFKPDNNWAVSNLELGTRTEMKYSSTKVDNCTLKDGWEKGATYTIKIELTDDTPGSPKAFITITKK